jgi:hypothetical protein
MVRRTLKTVVMVSCSALLWAVLLRADRRRSGWSNTEHRRDCMVYGVCAQGTAWAL